MQKVRIQTFVSQIVHGVGTAVSRRVRRANHEAVIARYLTCHFTVYLEEQEQMLSRLFDRP